MFTKILKFLPSNVPNKLKGLYCLYDLKLPGLINLLTNLPTHAFKTSLIVERLGYSSLLVINEQQVSPQLRIYLSL